MNQNENLENNQVQWRPIEPNFYKIPDNDIKKVCLVGSRCSQCAEVYFPKTPQCLKCYTETTEDIELSRVGKVYSSTVVHLAPPMYQGKVPYMIGNVELDNGVLIPTRFADTGEIPLAVGTKVELVMEKLGEDDQGRPVLVHAFTP